VGYPRGNSLADFPTESDFPSEEYKSIKGISDDPYKTDHVHVTAIRVKRKCYLSRAPSFLAFLFTCPNFLLNGSIPKVLVPRGTMSSDTITIIKTPVALK